MVERRADQEPVGKKCKLKDVHAERRAGASTSLQAVCPRVLIPARTPAGSLELRTLGASVVLTAVDAAGAMSRGWERKKARLFEHYMALMIEQVASPLPSLPPGVYKPP